MKKLIALLMVICLVAVCFVGCKNKDKDSDTALTSSEQQLLEELEGKENLTDEEKEQLEELQSKVEATESKKTETELDSKFQLTEDEEDLWGGVQAKPEPPVLSEETGTDDKEDNNKPTDESSSSETASTGGAGVNFGGGESEEEFDESEWSGWV